MGVLTRLGAFSSAALLSIALTACPPPAPDNTEFGVQDLLAGDAGLDGAGMGSGERIPEVVPTLDGTWLVYAELSTCLDFVRTEELLRRSVFIVESVMQGPQIAQETWTACDIKLTPILNLESVVTPELLEASYPVIVDSLVTGTELESGYNTRLVELWGVEFDSPYTDPWIEGPEDLRIVDTDEDGNPGVTMPLGDFCLTFMAQRAVSTFQGFFIEPDRIEGTLISITEQNVIGATQSFCTATYETRSNDSRNFFIRQRIDGEGNALDFDADADGTITCDEVMARVDEIAVRLEADAAFCEQ